MNYRKQIRRERFGKTVREMFLYSTATYPDKMMLRQIGPNKEEQSITFRQMRKKVVALGSALLAAGFEGKHIAIIGEASIEWFVAYYATVCGVGVAVPIDKELDIDTMALQVNHCDSEVVFFSSLMLNKIRQIKEKCPKVRLWVMMRSDMIKTMPEEFPLMETFLKNGDAASRSDDCPYMTREVLPDDMCDIIYTSGTTGANKGVMLSHKNIVACVAGATALIKMPDLSFSTLPVNHSFEKNCNFITCMANGTCIAINDSIMHLVQNVGRFQPNTMIVVPMILETIQRKIETEIRKNRLEKHNKFAMKVSDLIRHIGIDCRRLWFKPILTKFGGKRDCIVSGGAPLKEETRKFFDSIGITVVNGYGITECSPLVCANSTRFQHPGTVGIRIPGCRIKIENPDASGNGTVWAHGNNIMMGYYKDPESTKRVLNEDGWLDTGDIGRLDRHHFLHLSGRVKNLIILSNGKNVSPEEVEELLSSIVPCIKESVVYADKDGSGIYATVFLDADMMKELNVPDPYQYVMGEIARFNRIVPPYKRITDITITEQEFAKTTTNKIQRFKVEKKFGKGKSTADV